MERKMRQEILSESGTSESRVSEIILAIFNTWSLFQNFWIVRLFWPLIENQTDEKNDGLVLTHNCAVDSDFDENE